MCHTPFGRMSATMDRGRFSFMGAQGGPLWRTISYHLPTPTSCTDTTSSCTTAPASSDHAQGAAGPQQLTNRSQDVAGAQQPQPDSSQQSQHTSAGLFPRADVTVPCAAPDQATGTVYVLDRAGRVVSHRMRFFDYLRALLDTHSLQVTTEAAEQLPFNFWGGLVGYLGYELKAECGGAHAHSAATPDATLLFADRLVALDHHTGDVYLLAVELDSGIVGTQADTTCNDSDSADADDAEAWLSDMEQRVSRLVGEPATLNGHHGGSAPADSHPRQDVSPTDHSSTGSISCACDEHALGPSKQHDQPEPALQVNTGSPPEVFQLKHTKPQYLDNISECLSALHAGESYEVCLTTALVRRGAPPPATLYKTLRTLNPAPYGAWLHFGAAGPRICCSSPERFLRGDRGGVLEARPIKGTAARHLRDPVADAAAATALAGSEKDRAENLMIVDLLRNDLGVVCEVGSVHVPGLMEIESYATVHQMVSTVRGVRRRDMSLVDALQAAFPAGSMTGAPKVRTMAIIDKLEGTARGVYSGCIGFISLNDCFDLNVVIRTAIIDNGSSLRDGSEILSASAEARHGHQRAVVSIGAGGAIVVQSDLEGEFEEMCLKARALRAAVGQCDGTDGPAGLDVANAWSLV